MNIRTIGPAGLALGALSLGLGACASKPVARNDVAVVSPGSTESIDVLANDSDEYGPLTVTRAWGVGQGTLTVNPDNSISYAAVPTARGNDTFKYQVQNRRGRKADGEVSVNLAESRVLVDDNVILATPETVLVPDRVVTERVVVPETVVIEREPRTVVVTPAPAPDIDSVLITLSTVDDDKNRDEPVRVVLRRGQEILGDATVGAGQLWGAGTHNSVELDLKPGVRLDRASDLTLDVLKSAKGPATGGGWTTRVEMLGRLDDGGTVTLLTPGQIFKLGDGHPTQISVPVPMR